MPAKYSHVKKRSASGLLKKSPNNAPGQVMTVVKDTPSHHRHHRPADPLLDRTLTQAMSAVSALELTISRILQLRYDADIARLYSTRLYSLALIQLPTLVMRCIVVGGPGWAAWNCEGEEVKEFFRSVVGMDLRQSGERVATKSVLWSYTMLRQFVRPPSLPPLFPISSF